MTSEPLRLENSALIIVDLQVGTSGNPFVSPFDGVAELAGHLARAFRAHGRPVVIATYTPAIDDAERAAEFARPVPALEPNDDDILIPRPAWSAFHDTELAAELTARAVDTVVVAGVATSIGVESTARAARDHGLRVHLVSDGVTDLRTEAHESTLRDLAPLVGGASAATHIIDALRGRA